MKELSKELDRLQLLVGPQTSEEEYSGNGNLSIRTDVSDKSFDSSKHKDGDRHLKTHRPYTDEERAQYPFTETKLSTTHIHTHRQRPQQVHKRIRTLYTLQKRI